MSKTIYNKCTFNITAEAPSMKSGWIEAEAESLKPIEHQCNCCKEHEALNLQVHHPLLSKEAQEKFRKDFLGAAKAVSEAIIKAKKASTEKEV